jgi:hypothetical protein
VGGGGGLGGAMYPPSWADAGAAARKTNVKAIAGSTIELIFILNYSNT